MIPLNRVKIDSLRLIIPQSEVKILSDTFTKIPLEIYYDDGTIEEIEHPQPKLNIFKKEDGIRFKLGRHAISNFSNEEYISIILSAKMLKEMYFMGIDKTNIHIAHSWIQSLGIIDIPKEAFLNAKVVDVDLCYDLILQEGTISELTKLCNEISIPNKEVNITHFKSKTNKGIQWGKREWVGKAYKTKQFLKYYGKLVSLKHDPENAEFYEKYAKKILFEKTLFSDGTEYKSPFTEDNFLRAETTIKNKDHFQTYGENIDTLRDLLNLDISTDYKYFKRPQSVYMSGYKEINTNIHLTFQDRVYFKLLEAESKLHGLDVMEIISFVVNDLHPFNTDNKNLKQSRHNLKKKLIQIVLYMRESKQKNSKSIGQQIVMEFQRHNLIR